MKHTFSFHFPVITSTASQESSEVLDLSIEAFENGDFLTAMHTLLDSIHPDLRKRFGNVSGQEFHIPHGAMTIIIRFDKEHLHIKAPLVYLPAQEQIAIMRQAAAINFQDLDLSRIVLQDNQLNLDYHSPCIHSHPKKIYNVLKEICHIGEKCDRIFTHEFDAERIIHPRFTPYDFGATDYIYEAIQQSCRECQEALRLFETSRQFNEMWNILNATFLKLIYVAQPQGELLHLLQNAIRDLGRDLPLAEIVHKGKTAIRELQEKSKEDISTDLFYAETFIPGKHRSNLQNIREEYNAAFKQITTYMEAGDLKKAGIRMINLFYDIYYQNQVQEDLNLTVGKALSETSAQPWSQAAPILYSALENIMLGKFRKNISHLAA